MALDNLRTLYQQVILEHYNKSRHLGMTDLVHRHQRGHHPSCGNTIELTVQLEALEERIADVQLEGEGCAIAMVSTDFMADAIPGKTIPEALQIVQAFQNMMKGEGDFPREHRQLNVMQGVTQLPVRIKCATLTWHTLKPALEHQSVESADEFVSNEEDD
ncbi:Fe-S cluster assembly sulfur transfer protein SufU [Acaryochloris sp. CCMEE 5410]|uniref:Fe-S cluster assembly sulfur transfer protein SufU n=1 Tax=Acaryochloris sp. CCMEE 5410 TaxID=310037 RepID=UPI0002485294|nr:SUF system NifU family Fe-S cluster assembly protein [Acaryochloris sp. CCMEE 5410]KAI9135195.1 SUF system NifU family Fe-S cluster assembly protein [Acaryochloris sp. CCMEE 5410]